MFEDPVWTKSGLLSAPTGSESTRAETATWSQVSASHIKQSWESYQNTWRGASR